MDIINVSCSEIYTPAGFLFVILPLILNYTNNPDCEQSWLSEDGRLVADPSDPQKLMDPVISVSSDRLVTSHCVDELRHEIYCPTTRFRLDTIFRARNQTAATPNSVTPDLQHPDQLWWISALIVILLLVLICFLLRKRIFRCFYREAQFVSQREAPDNTDLVTVGSDPPGIDSVN